MFHAKKERSRYITSSSIHAPLNGNKYILSTRAAHTTFLSSFLLTEGEESGKGVSGEALT